MSAHAAGRGRGRVVLRPRFGPWLTGVAALVCVVLVVQSLAAGYVADTLRIAPWLLLVLWVMVVLLVRPSVVIDDDTLTVTNVLRRHVLPWATVDDVTLRYQMRVHLREDRWIVCWGAPAVGLDRTAGAKRDPQGSRTEEATTLRRLVWDHVDHAPATDVPARSGWDVVGVVGSVVVVVLLVASVVL